MIQRFSLGKTLKTQGALDALIFGGQSAAEFLSRHQPADWQEIKAGYRIEIELSIESSFHIHSAYQTARGEMVWVITLPDCRVTMLLLPGEY
jgi:hypothetical protein